MAIGTEGQIVKLDANEAAVFYVDYGNVEKIPLSKVKQIKSDFLELACQALRCELHGLPSNDIHWNSDILEKLQMAVSEPITLTVVDKMGDTNTVKLSDEQGMDIAVKIGLVAQPSQPAVTQICVPPPTAETVPSFSFNDLNLPQGVVKNVQVSHVNGVSDFYCQLIDGLTELEKYMEEVGSQAESSPQLTCPRVGMPCVAKYTEDDAWYRALITNLTTDSKLEVLFVDYGNTELLQTSRVRTLPEHFRQLPKQAFKCQLADVATSALPDSAATFEELVVSVEELECTIKSMRNGKFDVQLNIPDGLCINEEISSTFGQNQELTREESTVKADKPEAVTLDAAFLPPEILSEEADVYVTATVSPSQFYVQLVGQETAAQELAEKLLDEYSALQPCEREMKHVTVGRSCVARFSEDEAWYRAIVKEVSAESAKVLFIDYGNSDGVPLCDIRELAAQYVSQPAMAVECSLDMDEPASGWSDKDITKFEQLTESGAKLLQVEFLTTSQPCQVRLFDKTVSIASLLTSAEESAVVEAAEQKVDKKAETTATVTTTAVWSGQSYPEVAAPSGRCQMYMSHIESPAEVYLQLVKQELELQELMDKIEEKCAYLSENERKLSSVMPDQPCCVKSSADNVWYRAKVKAVGGDDNTSVHFVDYGYVERMDLKNMKEMPPELLVSGPMAICTSLGLMCPPSGWSDEVIDKVHELTAEKVLTVEFKSDTVPFEVQIFDKDVNINQRVAAMLLQTTQTESVTEEAVKPTDVMPFKEEEDNAGLDTLTAPSSSDDKADEFNMTALSELAQTKIPADVVKVYTSSVESPGHFYVQLVSNGDEIQALTNRLTETYSADNDDLQLQNPITGHLCCTKYLDDLWYRAVIRNIAGDSCSLRFVDYGNVEEVPIADIKKLKPDFLSEPPYAYACRLMGIDSTIDWTDADTDKFSEAATERELQAKFVGYSAPYEVQLKHGEQDLSFLFEDKLEQNKTTKTLEEVNAETSKVESKDICEEGIPTTTDAGPEDPCEVVSHSSTEQQPKDTLETTKETELDTTDISATESKVQTEEGKDVATDDTGLQSGRF